MEIITKRNINSNGEVDIVYTEKNTSDKFSLKEEEKVREEIINILAKYNLSYWKAKLILKKITDYLVKNAVVRFEVENTIKTLKDDVEYYSKIKQTPESIELTIGRVEKD